MSWYAPYKSLGDEVITLFCYLCFIWHLFIKASSIIQGLDTASGTVRDSEYFIENGRPPKGKGGN